MTEKHLYVLPTPISHPQHVTLPGRIFDTHNPFDKAEKETIERLGGVFAPADDIPVDSHFLRQSVWSVDSLNGNDDNDGMNAPLRTFAELNRRWKNAIFAPSITAVTISLTGTFPDEGLYLDSATFTCGPNPCDIDVIGKMTTVATGTTPRAR